jgi:hypothetical protein
MASTPCPPPFDFLRILPYFDVIFMERGVSVGKGLETRYIYEIQAVFGQDNFIAAV